jgi:hypothetical protein
VSFEWGIASSYQKGIIAMSSAQSTSSPPSPTRYSVLDAFAKHLEQSFQMPAERALECVNRELAANPLTRDIQLQLHPTDLPQE